jgi:hypothetical protein
VVVTISVITNAGLIVFALDIFPAGYSVAFQYWVFILFQWVLFFLQVGCALGQIFSKVN